VYLYLQLGVIVGLAVLVLFILGVIGAIQGKKQELPLIGKHFQDWFKSIG